MSCWKFQRQRYFPLANDKVWRSIVSVYIEVFCFPLKNARSDTMFSQNAPNHNSPTRCSSCEVKFSFLFANPASSTRIHPDHLGWTFSHLTTQHVPTAMASTHVVSKPSLAGELCNALSAAELSWSRDSSYGSALTETAVSDAWKRLSVTYYEADRPGCRVWMHCAYGHGGPFRLLSSFYGYVVAFRTLGDCWSTFWQHSPSVRYV